jgi:hypothetical protein
MQEGKSGDLYEKYRIESEIGRGASGVCYRVQNIRTKEVFAMKKIHVTSIKVFGVPFSARALVRPAWKFNCWAN